MRVFLRNEKGKSRVDGVLKRHGYFNDAGPMWLGNLWDKNLCNNMYNASLKNEIFNKNKELIKFLKIINDESKISVIGFYDLHSICKKTNIKTMQKKEIVINKIKKFEYKSSETHFSGHGIRSDITLNKLIKILK